MNRLLLTSTAVAGALLAAGPACADVMRLDLAGFTGVAASNHVRVVVRQGPYSVRVEEPNGRFADLDVRVRGSTLIASRRDRFVWSWWGLRQRPEYTITVTAPSIDDIVVTDHARLQAEVTAKTLRISVRDHGRVDGAFSAGRLDIAASDHGDLRGEISADEVSVRASDHGDVDYRGRCEELTVTATSHGDVRGGDLACGVARVEASDHGDVVVRAARSVSCRAASHGDIRVFGEAVMLTSHASDHGSIRRF